ncbi:MAG TPA: hypothetical protein VGE40_08340 [Bacilli bacterium]
MLKFYKKVIELLNSETEMKTIYLLLTDTGTLLNRLIKKYTQAPYNHISIAFDRDLKDLYSFGRKRPNNPINGSFVKEYIDRGMYAKFKETSFSLYSISVPAEVYERMMNLVKEFEQNQEKYTYNALGLLAFVVSMPIERKNAFFCSQFVATLFKNSDHDLFNKSPALVAPYDFVKTGRLDFIDSGILQKYNCNARVDNPGEKVLVF